MRFDLVDLRLFAAVVAAGSISKGAQAAHLSLASASARLSGMETALGTRLLTRGRRGVTPTAAGRTLVRHAHIVSAQIERMRGDLRAFATGLKSEVRLFCNTAALVELAPKALARFLIAHPDVDVDITEMTSVKIVQALAENCAAIGVVADSAEVSGLDAIGLVEDHLVVITKPGHPMSGLEGIEFADLLGEPFVGLRQGALYRHLEGHASRLGATLDYRVRLNSFDAVAKLVQAGAGIGVVPRSIADRVDAVAILPLQDRWAKRRLLLCAQAFDELSAHARVMAEEILGAARDGSGSAATLSSGPQ